jgi:hypothetical protein
MVLHTWTRDLRFHPHVHALVTAGGLTPGDARWAPSDRNYLFPVRVMGALLRGKMMAGLRELYERGTYARFDDFADPEAFDRLMQKLARTSWVVYAKKPFRRVEHVLAYLGRYTHRVGIANSRLVDVSDDAVTFRTKHGQTATLAAVEFLRRFVQHVLPARFHKIRHYGLYAGASDEARTTAVGLLAPAVAPAPPVAVQPRSWEDWLCALTGRDVWHCPRCGESLERRPIVTAPARAPPAARERVA